MQVVARTYHVLEGCPPRQYTVTFRVGEPRVSCASQGVKREYEFRGRGYRPGSHAHLAAIIATFNLAADAQGSQGPSVEQINEKLAEARRQPAAVNGRNGDAHERQLPVADRA